MGVSQRTAETDLIYNDGRSWGEVAAAIVTENSRPINFVSERRLYVDERGYPCRDRPTKLVTNEKGKKHWEYEKEIVGRRSVDNALMLRKEEWIDFDTIVVEETRKLMTFWADIAARSSVNINGWQSSVQEWETLEDTGKAMVDLDGLTDAPNFTPRRQLEGMPITCTHSDFFITKKELEISRKAGGQALDTTKQRMAVQRVLEQIEQTAIGTITGLTYGSSPFTYGKTSAVYGALNFPDRNTYNTLTTPTGSNATTTLSEVLAMRDRMYADNFRGPFMLYTSNDWDRYLDGDYVSSGGNNPNQTLRDRIKRLPDIIDVRRLDWLTSTTNPFTMIMIELSPKVVRAVIGLNPTTFQWEEKGGLIYKYKVLAMMMPQFRSTFSGNCGIVHATV